MGSSFPAYHGIGRISGRARNGSNVSLKPPSLLRWEDGRAGRRSRSADGPLAGLFEVVAGASVRFSPSGPIRGIPSLTTMKSWSSVLVAMVGEEKVEVRHTLFQRVRECARINVIAVNDS